MKRKNQSRSKNRRRRRKKRMRRNEKRVKRKRVVEVGGSSGKITYKPNSQCVIELT